MDYKTFFEEIRNILKEFVAGFESKDLTAKDAPAFEAAHSNCARLMLSEVKHPDLYFYLDEKNAVKSLPELAQIFPSLSKEHFYSHAYNNGKNNFAEWIKNVIGDYPLAEKMAELETQDQMANALKVRVDWLRKSAGLDDKG